MLPLMDGRVHHEVLSTFARLGRPPSLDELARALAMPPEDAAAALRRLHDGHGLVLHPDRAEVWIAHPFSASPTAVWVAAGARGWWAPCLWCASGIVALAAPTSTIHARYAGEHEAAAIEVQGGAAASGDLVVHFAIPPRDAWRRDAWRQVMELGRAWYGRHFDLDWRKHTIAEAQAIFDEVGLSGDFWRLPASDRPF